MALGIGLLHGLRAGAVSYERGNPVLEAVELLEAGGAPARAAPEEERALHYSRRLVRTTFTRGG